MWDERIENGEGRERREKKKKREKRRREGRGRGGGKRREDDERVPGTKKTCFLTLLALIESDASEYQSFTPFRAILRAIDLYTSSLFSRWHLLSSRSQESYKS